MSLLSSISQKFWTESIWTPPNATWELYEIKGYRRFNDIYYSFFTSALLIIIRFTLERYIYSPIGQLLGLRPGQIKKPIENLTLEKCYRESSGKVTDKQIIGLAKQLDWSERDVQRWLRIRSMQNRPTVLTKFTESAWKCTFYICSFGYGVIALWDKPYMWDSMYCFYDFPHHTVSSGEWWYYNFEIGFYIALIFSQFFDIKRKDFWAMFVHHLVTICLLVFSWACNLVRIGTLVLLIHDFADIPLQFAKLMIFTKKRKIADITFVIFTICWIVSRLGLLPYRILYFSMYRALEACQMFPAYYIFNGLLCTLQVLHIFWTYFMIKIVFYAIKTNELKDLRSDDEESFEEEIDNKNNGINGDKRIKTAKVTHDNANDKTAKNSKL